MMNDSSINLVASLSGVSKHYGPVKALDQVDLRLKAGAISAVLGPNGAGKTTLIELMLGVQQPDRGEIQVMGHRPGSRQSRLGIGAMLQVSGVPETLTVSELIRMFCAYYPQPLGVDELLNLTGLPDLSKRRYARLSGGQQRRVQFALAICGRPRVLFLDEPTVGMDVSARREFWDLIRKLSKQGSAIVLTTHYLEEADALADRIILLNKGRVIADDSPEAIKALTASKQVRCRTSLDLATLGNLPAVIDVVVNQGLSTIQTRSAEQTLKSLFEVDPDLQDLEVSGADLERAFLNLTAEPNELQGE